MRIGVFRKGLKMTNKKDRLAQKELWANIALDHVSHLLNEMGAKY